MRIGFPLRTASYGNLSVTNAKIATGTINANKIAGWGSVANGDVLVGSGVGTVGRLAAGSTNAVLTITAGAPAWTLTPTLTSLATTSGITAGNGLTVTNGGLVVQNAGGANINGNVAVSGTLTSGTVNGQTISAAANFTGTVAVATNATVGGTLGVTGTSTLGVVNAGAVSATSLAVSGALSLTSLSLSAGLALNTGGTLGAVIASATSGTAANYATFLSTGGLMYVGMDNSAGGAIFGSGAYTAGMYVPAAFAVRIGGGGIGLFINTSQQAQFPGTGSAAGLLVGGDVNWYRAAANVWHTDDSIELGASPAASGTLRLGNAGTVVFRNAANSADLIALQMVSDVLQVGSAAGSGTRLQLAQAAGAIFNGVGGNELTVGPNGVIAGAPTGGLKGFGTINAVAVYDDNTILTDFVFEPGYKLAPIDDMSAFFKQYYHLPTIPGRGEWERAGSFPLGKLATHLWETVEVQALYITELHGRVKALEEAR